MFCGCSEGVIRIFDPRTLDYLVTVPKPHSLGVDVAAALDARWGVRRWEVELYSYTKNRGRAG